MEDLEICKRIAEIEGVDFSINGEHIFYKVDGWPSAYNPLTDDALCFQLMVKYAVHTGHYGKDELEAYIDSCMEISAGPTMNHAICLAIIEDHEEK